MVTFFFLIMLKGARSIPVGGVPLRAVSAQPRQGKRQPDNQN